VLISGSDIQAEQIACRFYRSRHMQQQVPGSHRRHRSPAKLLTSFYRHCRTSRDAIRSPQKSQYCCGAQGTKFTYR